MSYEGNTFEAHVAGDMIDLPTMYIKIGRAASEGKSLPELALQFHRPITVIQEAISYHESLYGEIKT